MIFSDLKTIIKNFVFILISSVAVGFFLLLIIFSLPTKPIEQNALASLNILSEEGIMPSDEGNPLAYRDNFTDSLILLTALDNTDANIVERVVKLYRQDKNNNPHNSLLIYQYHKDRLSQDEYPRYWLGNQFIIKSFLSFMSYETIRDIFSCLHIYLMLVILVLLIKNKLFFISFPYILTLFYFINPYYTGKCLQYSWCLFIISGASIVLLLKNQKWQNTPNKFIYLFFITGIILAYIDLLSYPLATFGIPMCFYIFLNFSKPATENIKNTFLFLISWFMGYASMWVSKWILATLLTDEDVIQDALINIQYRISFKVAKEGENVLSFMNVLERNIDTMFGNSRICTVTLLALGLSTIFIIKNKQLKTLFTRIVQMLPLSVLPFIWYFILSNHSFIHPWYSYKILSITYFSVIGTFFYTAFMKINH